jgi:hypothetical protein
MNALFRQVNTAARAFHPAAYDAKQRHLNMKNILLLVSSLTMIWTVHATDMVGTVKTLKGTAQIERGHERIDVTIGTHLRVQDKLTSGPASSVGITLSDSTLLTAGPNSTIELSGYAFDRQSKAGHMDTTVKRGMLNVVSGQMAKNNPDQVVYRTNTVTLGVRGTEFIIDVGETQVDDTK